MSAMSQFFEEQVEATAEFLFHDRRDLLFVYPKKPLPSMDPVEKADRFLANTNNFKGGLHAKEED